METQTLNKNFQEEHLVFNWNAKEDARTKLEHERNLRELGIEAL